MDNARVVSSCEFAGGGLAWTSPLTCLHMGPFLLFLGISLGTHVRGTGLGQRGCSFSPCLVNAGGSQAGRSITCLGFASVSHIPEASGISEVLRSRAQLKASPVSWLVIHSASFFRGGGEAASVPSLEGDALSSNLPPASAYRLSPMACH